jgi:hypothetical protein
VDVQVRQAGADQQALRLENLLVAARIDRSDAGDTTISDQHIAFGIQLRYRIAQPSTPDEQITHVPCSYSSRADCYLPRLGPPHKGAFALDRAVKQRAPRLHLWDRCCQFRLPVRSPDLNGYAERWIRSLRQERVDRTIILNEVHLRWMLGEYVGSATRAALSRSGSPRAPVGKRVQLTPPPAL